MFLLSSLFSPSRRCVAYDTESGEKSTESDVEDETKTSHKKQQLDSDDRSLEKLGKLVSNSER